MFVMFLFRVPDLTIATDVICGFPTETAEVTVEFLNTFTLLSYDTEWILFVLKFNF